MWWCCRLNWTGSENGPLLQVVMETVINPWGLKTSQIFLQVEWLSVPQEQHSPVEAVT